MKNKQDVIEEFDGYVRSIKPRCTSDAYDRELCMEVLNLLHEQEAVEPDMRWLEFTSHGSMFTITCGYCHGEMLRVDPYTNVEEMKRQYKFCHHCGREVKWSE